MISIETQLEINALQQEITKHRIEALTRDERRVQLEDRLNEIAVDQNRLLNATDRADVREREELRSSELIIRQQLLFISQAYEKYLEFSNETTAKILHLSNPIYQDA